MEETSNMAFRYECRVGGLVFGHRMESFFATLKKEMLYRLPTYRMKRNTVKSLIFRYVFTCYNQKRVYTANPGGYPCSLGIS